MQLWTTIWGLFESTNVKSKRKFRPNENFDLSVIFHAKYFDLTSIYTYIYIYSSIYQRLVEN